MHSTASTGWRRARRTIAWVQTAVAAALLSGCGFLLGDAFDLTEAADGASDVVLGGEAGSSDHDGALAGDRGADSPSSQGDANNNLEASPKEASNVDAAKIDASSVDASDGATTSDAPIDSNGPESESRDGALADAASDSAMDAADSADSGVNLIAGGDFSNSGSAWHLMNPSTYDATFTAVGGEGCVTLGSTRYGGIGWPVNEPAPSLAAGQTYTFAYEARSNRATGTLNVDAALRHTVSPYTFDFESTSDAVTTTRTLISHTFVPLPDGGDDSVGINLQFGGNTGDEICFSNVSLTQN
jgi:hypothetical protein